MKIKILGNGGYINEGLPYNAFMIDGKALIECPPDIMVSLHREKIDILQIEEIYISHMHGDHCFGFPFIAMAFLYSTMKSGLSKKIKLFAPRGSMDLLTDLTVKALSADNPTLIWIKDNMDFVDTSGKSEIQLLKYTAKLYPMNHSRETYGFVLKDHGKNLLAYISDTKWSRDIEAIIKENPKVIMLDLNGEKDDPVPVHLCEEDIVEKGIGLIKPGTVFYGTHLKYQKKSKNKNIKYVKPGMDIKI